MTTFLVLGALVVGYAIGFTRHKTIRISYELIDDIYKDVSGEGEELVGLEIEQDLRNDWTAYPLVKK